MVTEVKRPGHDKPPFHYCGSNVPGSNSIKGRLFLLGFHSEGNWLSFTADLFTRLSFIPGNNCWDGFTVIFLSAAAWTRPAWRAPHILLSAAAAEGRRRETRRPRGKGDGGAPGKKTDVEVLGFIKCERDKSSLGNRLVHL